MKSLVEIGSFCKERNLIDDGRAGLQEICEIVLRKYLPKDLQLSDWTASMTQKHLEYCAKDALVSLQIFLAASKKGTLLSPSERGVDVHIQTSGCNQPVAKGIILLDQPDVFNNFQVGEDKLVAEVLDVYAKGYKDPYSFETCELGDLGPTPFRILFDISNLGKSNEDTLLPESALYF